MGLTHTQKLGRDIKGSESSGRPSLLFLIKRSKTILLHHRSFMCLLKRFWYKLYQFGGFHLTFQSEDDGPSAQRPTAVSEDQSCKAVLERVKFLDNPSKEESASCFTDVMTQNFNTLFKDLIQMIVSGYWYWALYSLLSFCSLRCQGITVLA